MATMTGPEPPTEWLIWSDRHNAWSAPGRRGYTAIVENAGRYTEAEARLICDPDLTDDPHETPVRAPRADLVSDLPLLGALAMQDLAAVENPILRAALARVAAENTGKPKDALAGFNSAF